MISPYSFDEDQRTQLEEKVFAKLSDAEVMRPLKKALDEVCQSAIDQTTEYLKGEYSLVLENIVRERAKRIVQELLKGNHEMAQYFHLEKGRVMCGCDAGKEVAYDFDGIRKAIVETFRGEIQTAEMLTLRRDNENLKKDLQYYRERERGYR